MTSVQLISPRMAALIVSGPGARRARFRRQAQTCRLQRGKRSGVREHSQGHRDSILAIRWGGSWRRQGNRRSIRHCPAQKTEQRKRQVRELRQAGTHKRFGSTTNISHLRGPCRRKQIPLQKWSNVLQRNKAILPLSHQEICDLYHLPNAGVKLFAGKSGTQFRPSFSGGSGSEPGPVNAPDGSLWDGKTPTYRSRFFAHHPRTYPKELSLFRALDTFGVPFAQNDTVYCAGCLRKTIWSS